MSERRSLWRILLEEFRRIEEELSRIEEDFLRRLKETETMRGCITPLYNLYESGDEIILTADMPGSNKDEIDLRASEDHLRIEAPCRSPLRKVMHGKYMLHIKLPAKIEPSSVKARYKDGVLEVIARKKLPGVRVKIE